MSQAIFYLEDSEICLDVTQLMFQEVGEFELDHVATIADCEKVLVHKTDTQYALILLDIMLPDGDSSSLVSHIKQKHTCPVVAFTAQSSSAELARLQASGFDDVLTKPLSFDAFKLMLSDFGVTP